MRKLGFTLIEVLVVMSILGIIGVIILTLVNPIALVKRSRDSRRKADLEAIRQALELYRADNGEYPPAGSPGWCTQISNGVYPQVKNALESGYISQVPKDPIYADTYQDYFYRNIGGQRYALYAELEMEDVADDFSGCARIGGTNNEYDYKVQNP